ncbi:hypothetical protein SAMN06295945_0339 [Polynucleobacter meluiroseus]|uniref:Uncharacterized protein n=1 Tax=Polynucleobacter meluiroseus TaxID=1938814 RepID=A0A240DZH8_9BURK|nr:hypothetical protein [Polynucleobacter meluiroseus]SNX28020.1 hypothetical protein SAMN06295945_0339 [Polynucleobacter meluiroseus]
MNYLTRVSRLYRSQTLVLVGFLAILGLNSVQFSHAQQNSQALSPAELQQINNQPLAPAVNASQVTNSPQGRTPTFQHKASTGTQITEYKDANSPTQVEVKTKYTTYEMSPPDSVKPGAQSGEGSLLSVPSVSIPF